jgi:hypothetical protein
MNDWPNQIDTIRDDRVHSASQKSPRRSRVINGVNPNFYTTPVRRLHTALRNLPIPNCDLRPGTQEVFQSRAELAARMNRPASITQSRRRPQRSKNLRRFEFVQLAQKFPIERNHHDFVDKLLLSQQTCERPGVSGFVFNERHPAVSADEIQRLNQSRNLSPRKLRIKPPARIQRLNLRRRLLRNLNSPPFPSLPRICGPIENPIVNHHRHAVFAALVIQFDQIRPSLEPQFEGWQGILRRNGTVTAMANQQWPFAFQQPFGNGCHVLHLALKIIRSKLKRTAGCTDPRAIEILRPRTKVIRIRSRSAKNELWNQIIKRPLTA